MGVATSGAESRARTLGLALSVVAFLAYFDRYLPAAGTTLLKQELALSDAEFGLAAATMFAVAYAAASALAGLLTPTARRWSIAGGIVLWTTGSAALAFVQSLAGFAAAEIAIGVGQACVLPAAVTVLAGAGGAARIGRSTSSFTVGSTLGRSSSVLVAGLLIGGLAQATIGLIEPSWRAVFLLTALPNLGLFGWIVLRGGRVIDAAMNSGGDAPARTMPPPGHSDHLDGTSERLRHASGNSWRSGTIDEQHLRWRPLIALLVAASAAVLVLQAVGVWFPTLLVRRYDLTPADAAVAAGAITLAAAPAGQALGGQIVDRWPRLGAAPTGLVTGALALACFALWSLVIAPGVATSLILLGVVDLVLGVASLAALAGVQAQTGGTARGRANGLFFAGITVTGYGLGPLIVGALSDAAPPASAGLAFALGVAAAGAVLMAGAAHCLAWHSGRKAAA